MRISSNILIKAKSGNHLYNGYDYINQAWVIKGKYIKCGHPKSMDCNCYGRLNEGTNCLIIGK